MSFKIGGTLVWYYHICKREVWLMAHSIEADQEDEVLALGKELHEHFYKRQKKSILIDDTIQIDIIPHKGVVGEIKKSSRSIEAATMQLAYYLYYLKQKGVLLDGELLIPKERKKKRIRLTPNLEEQLQHVLEAIEKIAALPKPPKPVKVPYCKRCAYREFCWS